ncbi:MAG: hypothetical protein R3C15_20405 [Thermoleophilia bacterium]
MGRIPRRWLAAAVVALAATLTVGAGAALAGPGKVGGAAATAKLVADAATRLSITTDALKQAIVASANAAVDDAVSDEDLDALDGEDLKEEAAADLRVAIALSRTRTVASNAGVTTAQLNAAFREARRAQAIARVDRALAAGRIDQAEADERKAELATATLPGYKAGGALPGLRGPGPAGPGGGPGGPGGPGRPGGPGGRHR